MSLSLRLRTLKTHDLYFVHLSGLLVALQTTKDILINRWKELDH